MREHTGVESRWDARFIVTPDNYGVRFRNEPDAALEALPPVELSKVPGKTPHGEPSDRPGIGIRGLRREPAPPDVYGKPEPAVDASTPVTFPDGSKIRLKLIVGLNGEWPSLRTPGEEYDWAITPDGKPAPAELAKDKLHWARSPEDNDRCPFGIRCLFEPTGNVTILSASVADAESGMAAPPNRGFARLGDMQWVTAGLTQWTPGRRELLLTVAGGPMQDAALPANAGEQITLNGTPIRVLGHFPEFKGWDAFPREDYEQPGTPWVIHDDGNSWGTSLTLLLLPRNACAKAFRVKEESGDDPFRPRTLLFDHFGGLVSIRPDEAMIKKGLRLEGFSNIRRIRLRLPDFPSTPAPAGVEDPLDWEIPKDWKRKDMSVHQALIAMARIREVKCLVGDGNMLRNQMLGRKLSDFPGKTTLRFMLAELYAEELKKGMILEFDRRERFMILRAPEPTRLQRVADWTQHQLQSALAVLDR